MSGLWSFDGPWVTLSGGTDQRITCVLKAMDRRPLLSLAWLSPLVAAVFLVGGTGVFGLVLASPQLCGQRVRLRHFIPPPRSLTLSLRPKASLGRASSTLAPPTTSYSRHRPGTPLRMRLPRGSKTNPDPTTRSRTVLVTRIASAPASAEARGDVDGKAGDVGTRQFDFPGVQPRPDVDAELARGGSRQLDRRAGRRRQSPLSTSTELDALAELPVRTLYNDQSIYGWRLADVRRVLALADSLQGLRRVDLVVNYRCPATVVRRAVRLVEYNAERFAKTIEPRPDAPGPIVLAADAADDSVRVGRLLETWFPPGTGPAASADPGQTQAILTRTNRELLPAIAAAIDRAIPFRPPPVELLVGSPSVDARLAEAAAISPDLPHLARIETVRSRWADRPVDPDADPDAAPPSAIAAAVLGWASRFQSLEALADAVAARRAALLELCRDDASLTFATAHATKGLEFDHVAVLGMERSRFPSARSLTDAPEPARALEEERRLAYVAWTRARRSLTLIYDPDAPSSFLLEAFSQDELGLEGGAGNE
jgi:hypothetical protein